MCHFGTRLKDQSRACAWSPLELTLLPTAQAPGLNTLCQMPTQEDTACFNRDWYHHYFCSTRRCIKKV